MAATNRKKKEKASSSSASSNVKRDDNYQVLEGEINRAIQAVEITKHRTDELQVQWRAQLLRMSYLVVLLIMHQCSTPVSECIKEFKLIDNDGIVASTKMGIILSNCIVEVMNLVIGIALFKFLSLKDPHGNFSNVSYCISSTMIIFCMGMFFHNYNLKQKSSGDVVVVGSCLSDLASWTGDEQYLSIETPELSDRQFPVACVFHVIVTGCYFFMKMGMDQCDSNIAAMEKLYKELASTKKIKTTPTNTKSASSKKSE